jgi:L,D-transpeptidase-like protein
MRGILPWIGAALLCGCVVDVPQRLPPASVHTPPPAGRAMRGLPNASSVALLDQLAAAAPEANPAVLRLALQARRCAMQSGVADRDGTLGVIDYTLPSTQRRLWVFGLDGFHRSQTRLLFVDYVAHGRGSGENLARRFSNADGSLQSSLGLFRTAETYDGDNGYSLRLDGLEPGVNDHARSRALVMHGAWYVDPLLGEKQGRLGRSLGCPALRPAVAHAVIDTLKQGQLLFAYYPDPRWLSTSKFLHCNANPSGG